MSDSTQILSNGPTKRPRSVNGDEDFLDSVSGVDSQENVKRIKIEDTNGTKAVSNKILTNGDHVITKLTNEIGETEEGLVIQTKKEETTASFEKPESRSESANSDVIVNSVQDSTANKTARENENKTDDIERVKEGDVGLNPGSTEHDSDANTAIGESRTSINSQDGTTMQDSHNDLGNSSEKTASKDGVKSVASDGVSKNVAKVVEDVNQPIDLSVKSSGQTAESPDIIVLSDNSDDDSEPGLMNGVTPGEKKEKVVRKLQRDLQNEEAKLVLLKKIRQSQMTRESGSSVQPQVKTSATRTINAALPPLVRQQQGHAHPNQTPQAAHTGPSHSMLSQRSTGPPPLVNMTTPSGRSSQSNASSGIHRTPLGTTNASSSSTYRSPHQQTQPVDTRTPEQRQQAAKMALRKQLEKTLLQIPPPKPPVPEMNFIPSLSSGEFLVLVGLQEVVNFIMDSDKGKPEMKYVFNPFTCVQCKTDFTPVWKRDKPGSKNVICEICVISNQKKALKQEHTNRLKSAFVKALQQEQQIEQQLAAAENDLASTTASTASSHNTSSPMAGSVAAAAMNYTQKVVTNEQLRQHQNLLHAHQAQMRTAMSAGMPGLAYNPLAFAPFHQMPHFNKGKQADAHQQYLLDMITPPRTLSNATSSRKHYT